MLKLKIYRLIGCWWRQRTRDMKNFLPFRKFAPFILTLMLSLIWANPAKAAISLIYAGSASSTNGADVTVNLTGASTGDLVIFYGGHGLTTTAIGPSGPSEAGYTLINSSNRASVGPHFGVWYKVMGATADSTVVGEGGGNGSDGVAYAAYVLRGQDTSSPFDATATTAGPTYGTNPNPPSITTATNDAWVVPLSGSTRADTSTGTVTNYGNKVSVVGDDTQDLTTAGVTRLISASGTAENPPAWSSWSAGSWYSVSLAIRRKLVPPTVETNPVTSVSYTTASGSGNITSIGDYSVTRRGFAWLAGTTGNPTTADNVFYEDGTYGTGGYLLPMSGFTAGTAYRVRAYVVNPDGTSYGDTVDLTTLSYAAPTVTTQAVTNIGYTTASGSGNITSVNGQNATRRGFAWIIGTSGNPTTADNVFYEDGDYGAGAYLLAMSGFSSGTAYRVRAYAVNPTGTGYGDTVDFTTLNTETISGIVYSTTNEAVAYDCSSNPLTIYLRVNNSGAYTDLCDQNSGAWEISGVGVSDGQTIYAYIYSESVKGSTVLVSNGTDQTNVPIIIDRVVLRDDSNASITNTEISTGNSTDGDDLITFSGSDLTVNSSYEIHIYTSDAYAPGASVSTGKLHVVGNYTGSTETLTLTGSGTSTSRPLYVNGGTFTAPAITDFEGVSDSSIEATIYKKLTFTPTISGSASYTFLGASSVNGDFTVDPTSTGTNPLTVSLGGTLMVSSSNTTTLTGTTSGLSILDTVEGSNYTFSTGILDINAAGTFRARNSNIYLTGIAGVGATSLIFSDPGTTSWSAPSEITSVTVKAWGGGGGGAGQPGLKNNQPGGGGGEYRQSDVTVDPGSSYSIVVGTGGAGSIGSGGSGGQSSFDTTSVVAMGGRGAIFNASAGGSGGYGGTGTIGYVGGNGVYATTTGGGGGGGAGSGGAGGAASLRIGGSGGIGGGGNGGNGSTGGNGSPGSIPGGGGGGGFGADESTTGGSGARGQVILEWGASSSEAVFTKTGTFTAGSSTTYFSQTSNDTILTSGSISFYNLNINMSGRTGTLGNAIIVDNNLTLTAGSFGSGNYPITVKGDWDSSGGGVFSPGTGTVYLTGLDQTISGNNNFYNLAVTGSTARTVTFAGNSITSIPSGGSLNFQGFVGQLLTLQSSDANDWHLHVDNGASTSVSYVSVTNSDASGYKQIDASSQTNVDGGSGGTNTNWAFYTASTHDLNFDGLNLDGLNIN